MHPQDLTSIIRFLKDNIEPIEDQNYGPGYRASAVLTDGTPIPCVIFRNPKTIVEPAMRRFDQERSGKGIFSRSSGLGYKDIVKTLWPAATRWHPITSRALAKAVLLFHYMSSAK